MASFRVYAEWTDISVMPKLAVVDDGFVRLIDIQVSERERHFSPAAKGFQRFKAVVEELVKSSGSAPAEQQPFPGCQMHWGDCFWARKFGQAIMAQLGWQAPGSMPYRYLHVLSFVYA